MKTRMPVVTIANDLYDPDQGDQDSDDEQKPEEKVPVCEELIFMKYTDGGDPDDDDFVPRHGYVFFYPDSNTGGICKIIEVDVTDDETSASLVEFESWICKILYIVNTEQTLVDPKKHHTAAAQQRKHIDSQCIPSGIGVLLRQQSINDIFDSKKSLKARTVNMHKAVRNHRSESLAQQMSKLKVGQEDLKEMSNVMVSMQVTDRLIQVLGHFFKYDPILDENVLIKEGLFLSVDNVINQEKEEEYIIHVFDQTGKVSFSRSPITTERMIQLVEGDQVLMWVGDQRATREVPAWAFYIVNPADVTALKGCLTKALFETNTREEFKKLNDSTTTDNGDIQWLEAQMVADDNVIMEGQEQVDFDDFNLDESAIEETQSQADEHHQNYDYDFSDEEESKLDLDLEPDLRDGDNRECVQAFSYDRAFVVNGPVVKVYKNSEEEVANEQRLKYLMHLPVLKDQSGNHLEPTNLIMHNNESNLMFIDKQNHSKVINYDLEVGKVVEEFDCSGVAGGVDKISAEIKNGQNTASQLFQGIGRQSMFTLDPRINKASKLAVNRQYKTDTMFSSIATTLTGGLAIGSKDGKIRLYKECGKDARTLLPGLGDPIVAIEASMDGQWVLATTKTYLLVIPTLCSNGKTGFDHRMGKEKPNPKKLSITAKDMAKFGIKDINFRAARFNNFTGNGDENSIVTSTGDFLITWSFSRIKQGVRPRYQIKPLETAPIDNQFRINHEEKILVTDEKTVGVQMRKKKVSIKY